MRPLSAFVLVFLEAIKVNVKKQRHFNRSMVIFKLESNILYALKYILVVIKDYEIAFDAVTQIP